MPAKPPLTTRQIVQQTRRIITALEARPTNLARTRAIVRALTTLQKKPGR